MDDIAKRLGVSKGAIYLYSLAKRICSKRCARHHLRLSKRFCFLIWRRGKSDPSATQFFDKMAEAVSIQPGLSFEILAKPSRKSQSEKNIETKS